MKAPATDQPDDLYSDFAKTQIALAPRVGELLQQGNARWTALFGQVLNREALEARTGFVQLAGAPDMRELAAAPLDAFWRSWQESVAAAQDVAQTTITNQTAFTAGFRRALAGWQQATARAMSHSRNAMPLHSATKDMLRTGGILAAIDAAPAREARAGG